MQPQAADGNTRVQETQKDEEIKKVALTFDDGPNPNYTEKLLKGLKKRGVKATFFLLGEQVEEYPQIDYANRKNILGFSSRVHGFSMSTDNAYDICSTEANVWLAE